MVSSSSSSSSVAALRVADGKRGHIRVPLGGAIENGSCIRCGAKASVRRMLLVDGKYRYRTLLYVIAALSFWSGPALTFIVPMLTFMRRQSREHMRIHVGMCAVCDDWLKRHARTSRVLEALAAVLLPIGGTAVGVAVGGVAGLFVGPLVGAALTVAAVFGINRRGPEDHARLVGADARGWLLDVPATWRNAIAMDPRPGVAAMAVDDDAAAAAAAAAGDGGGAGAGAR